MKARLVTLLTLLAMFTLALPALAKRPAVAAKTTATLRATASDTAASAGTVKKGDMLTVLGTQADWSNVSTAAGKKGWVKTSVVSDAKTASANSDTTTIAAAESTTEGAIRGKGVKRKTVIVGTGDVTLATANQVADAARKIPQVTVVDTRVDAKGSTGGVAGAHALGDAKGADVVVVLTSGKSVGQTSYEIVDLKKDVVIATGMTKSSAAEIGDALNAALLGNAPAAETSPAAATASPAASDDCVKKCVDANQMKASTLDAIKADCAKQCEKK